MFGLLVKNKPVKVRDFRGNKKYGVAAKDLKELLQKVCKLLQVSFVLLVFIVTKPDKYDY